MADIDLPKVASIFAPAAAFTNTELDIPSIFGVLTVNHEQQAYDRLGGIHGHKGQEAAIAALKMIHFNSLLHS